MKFKIINLIYSLSIVLISILTSSHFANAQNSKYNLNGKVFRGTVTEITPPDVDRMPKFYNELIRFENGKLQSDLLNMYSVRSSNYFAEVDGRRMIAVTVVEFKSKANGTYNGENVSIEYYGNIYADIRLSGYLTLKFPDNSEMKFEVNATAE